MRTRSISFAEAYLGSPLSTPSSARRDASWYPLSPLPASHEAETPTSVPSSNADDAAHGACDLATTVADVDVNRAGPPRRRGAARSASGASGGDLGTRPQAKKQFALTSTRQTRCTGILGGGRTWRPRRLPAREGQTLKPGSTWMWRGVARESIDREHTTLSLGPSGLPLYPVRFVMPPNHRTPLDRSHD